MSNPNKELEKIIGNFTALPYLFIGSGLSQRYYGTECWEYLLRMLAARLGDEKFRYYKGLHKDDLASIASHMERDYHSEYYQNQEKRSQLGIQTIPQEEQSVFKIAVAEHFQRQNKLRDDISEDIRNEYHLLMDIGKRSITGVITTNYDNLVSRIFPTFREFTGQQELIFSNSTGIAEIYKIHGSFDVPNSIIITKEDYDEFNKRNAYLAAKLLTIFMEHPIIFLGYSVSDPNIREILRSIVFCLNQNQIEKLKDKIIFVEYNKDAESGMSIQESHIIFDSGTLTYTMLKLHSFHFLFKLMGRKTHLYSPKLLRQIERDIYEIVKTNAPNGRLQISGDEAEQNDLLVHGVTLCRGELEYRYRKLSADELYLSVFDEYRARLLHGAEKQYIRSIVENVIPSLLPANSDKLPVFIFLSKYIKSGFTKDTIPPSIISAVQPINKGCFKKDKWPSRAFVDCSSLSEVITRIDKPHHWLAVCELPEELVSAEELEQYIVQDINALHKEHENTPKLETYIRTVIRYYDWIKYGISLQEEHPDLFSGCS